MIREKRLVRTVSHAPGLLLAVASGLLLLACDDGSATNRQNSMGNPPLYEDPPEAEAAAQLSSDPAAHATAGATVRVFFYQGEEPTALQRARSGQGSPLEAALGALLEGPTEEERRSGLESWFSNATAGMLEAAAIDPDGHAVVHFGDLRTVTAGGLDAMEAERLLASLNGTVFQFPEIRSVQYRIGNSCPAFWNWLGQDCKVLRRPQG